MQFVTVEDVGQLLERRTETVVEWLQQGRLPGLRIEGLLQIPMVAIWPYQHLSEDE